MGLFSLSVTVSQHLPSISWQFRSTVNPNWHEHWVSRRFNLQYHYSNCSKLRDGKVTTVDKLAKFIFTLSLHLKRMQTPLIFGSSIPVQSAWLHTFRFSTSTVYSRLLRTSSRPKFRTVEPPTLFCAIFGLPLDDNLKEKSFFSGPLAVNWRSALELAPLRNEFYRHATDIYQSECTW